jgi:hypothetical protein
MTSNQQLVITTNIALVRTFLVVRILPSLFMGHGKKHEKFSKLNFERLL